MNKHSKPSFFDFKICQRCLNSFLFRRFCYRNKQIYIEVQCSCLNSFVSLKQLFKYSYSIGKIITRNNYCYFLNNNNWEIIINKKNEMNEILNKFKCNCNEKKVKYCIDCKKFICNKCLNIHYYHKLFYYQPKSFISDKDLHKLEKYCYQSYINLKKSSVFIQTELNKKKPIKGLNDYINNYEKINDSLYALFKLFLLTFKASRTFTNYLNLSHFGFCNEPFTIKVLQDKFERIGKRFNFKNILVQYYQSNFLIPILSNNKFFSFVKEIKFIRRKKRNLEESLMDYFNDEPLFKYNSKTISSFYKGELLDDVFTYSRGPGIKIPFRVKNVLVLKDGRLAITFYNQFRIILIYKVDLNNFSFSFNMLIGMSFDIQSIIQIENSKLYVVDKSSGLSEIELREKDYILNPCCIHIFYWVKLDYSKVLLLGRYGIIYLKKGFDNTKKYNRRVFSSFTNFNFGYKLSNGLVLIKKGNLFHIIQINTKDKIVRTFEFTNNETNPICSENIQKKILYIQMRTHIILINTKTLQIQSIYNTFHFLFYPLSNSNNDLMSYFEKINFDIKKISNFMLKKGSKDIFQVSDNLLLVSTPQNFSFYKIN